MSAGCAEAFFPILMRMIPISSSQIVVTRPSMPPYEEYCAEIASLWESRWLTNRGEKHRELETALQGFLDTPNLALFTNGHLALENIVEALELGHDGRNEVITTPFTFVSTTNALARKGLKPVFAIFVRVIIRSTLRRSSRSLRRTPARSCPSMYTGIFAIMNRSSALQKSTI